MAFNRRRPTTFRPDIPDHPRTPNLSPNPRPQSLNNPPGSQALVSLQRVIANAPTQALSGLGRAIANITRR
jgi:hypothetical protein